MVDALLPYGRQTVEEDDVAAVVDVLRGDWLTQGPAIARFEEAICEATGARFAVAVANGTAALHLACLAAGVVPGETGITSDVTFVASANCIRYAGGRPVMCDVSPSSGLVSVVALREIVAAQANRGRPPRVIVPVDFSGAPADLPAIRGIADSVGAAVIEDAAHSLGAAYRADGRTVRAASCAHTEMAILSFHPVKHVTTGEGGAITTNDAALHSRLLELRTHGITKDPKKLSRDEGPWYYEQQALGYNYRITDIQCALGTSQLKKLVRFVARRRAIAQRYDEAFASLAERVQPLEVPEGVSSSYHLYVLRLRRSANESLTDVSERRRALFLALREGRIAPQVHYIPVHRQPDFTANGLASGEYPGAEEYYAGCISLPMFPAMSDADVDRVVLRVRAFLGG